MIRKSLHFLIIFFVTLALSIPPASATVVLLNKAGATPSHWTGLSSDSKPTTGNYGSTFYAEDTGIPYVYGPSGWVVDNRRAQGTATNMASAIHGATSKTPPVDADEIGLWDSVASVLKKLTWANLKATLIDTDATMAANSDQKVASQKAIKSYITTFAGDYLLKALGTGKGTLVGFSAASTPGTLSAGTDGYFLSADAASPLGFKWTAVPTISGVATNFLDGTGTYRNLATTDIPALTVAPAADGSYGLGSSVISGINGEAGSMALGDIVYIANGATNTTPTFKFAKAATTVDDKMPAVAMCMGTVTTGSTGTFLLRGTVQNTGWAALTVGGVGGLVWVSITGTTGNTWTQTKPVASGNVQMCLGMAVNDAYSAAHTGESKSMFFNPSLVWNVAP